MFFTPPQSLDKLSINLKSPKENTKHVGLLSWVCVTSLQQKVKSIYILEIHDTIVHQLVFDQWHFPTNVLAHEYGPLEVASKSKELLFASSPFKPKSRSSSVQLKVIALPRCTYASSKASTSFTEASLSHQRLVHVFTRLMQLCIRFLCFVFVSTFISIQVH
jgi:hypothetical protein